MKWYLLEDTANAAQAVSTHLEANQEDCEMHIISLMLGYAFGVKENYETRNFDMKDGTKRSVRSVTTPGGPFPEGLALIKELKELVNYFSSSGKS